MKISVILNSPLYKITTMASLFKTEASWLRKDADGNRIRSTESEKPSFISSLISKVMNNKVYYTYYTVLILLFILSFVDLILTFNNTEKSQGWEYAVGILGMISPALFFGIKSFNKESKVVAM